MMEMGALDTRQVKVLVLDEVDIMLSRGFEDQVHVPKLLIVYFIFLCNYLCTYCLHGQQMGVRCILLIS